MLNNNMQDNADDVQEAFNTRILRGDNGHFGMSYNKRSFTLAYGIMFLFAAFANSFLLHFLISFAHARFYSSGDAPQLIVFISMTFFIYSGLTFLFFNTIRNHATALLSLLAVLMTNLGERTNDKNDDRISTPLGEWIKLIISWVGIIPGAFAGVYATTALVDPAYVNTWSYGAPMIGMLTYLDPASPMTTPLASDSAVGFTMELLAGIILFFTYYWADGHEVIAKNRFFTAGVIGSGATFAALVAAPYTGAPVNILLWAVHAIRTGSTYYAVIYALAPLVAFLIPTVIVALMFVVNRFTRPDSMYNQVGSAALGTPGIFKSFKNV